MERPAGFSRGDLFVRGRRAAFLGWWSSAAGPSHPRPGSHGPFSNGGARPSVSALTSGYDSRPYNMPLTPPWNAPIYAVTPRPDGLGVCGASIGGRPRARHGSLAVLDRDDIVRDRHSDARQSMRPDLA